jgi:hypothetical protein
MTYSPGKPQGFHRPGRMPTRSRQNGDPVAVALNLLGDRRHQDAILRAIEARVGSDATERRYFAAAGGRVYGLSGQAALLQAVKNYLGDLARPDGADRTATLAHIAAMVAEITGTPSSPADADPFAAAEALFRRPA